jgi:enterochelin esterase-like enzyme
MDNKLKTVSPDTADALRDAQRKADQKVVDELVARVVKLEEKLDELKTENERLEAWLKSEKQTYRLQYFGSGGHV